MERVLRERQLSQRGWSLAAGLTERHVSVILTRARRDPGTRPDHDTMAALARAAGVRVEWLEDGHGEPHAAPQPSPSPMRHTPAHADPSVLDAALGMAFRPERHAVADLVAVRETMASVDLTALAPDALVRAVERWLDGAASLRARGEPVTTAGLLVRATVS